MLNRSTQAKNTETLYDLANIKSSELVYKSLRPSNIIKSENFVEKITKVMTIEYLNPIDVKLDSENLYKLSSGVPVEASLAEEILSVNSSEKSATKILLTIALEKLRRKSMILLPVIKRNYSKVQERMSFCITRTKNELWRLIGTSWGSC